MTLGIHFVNMHQCGLLIDTSKILDLNLLLQWLNASFADDQEGSGRVYCLAQATI